jgi:hypothetical protein
MDEQGNRYSGQGMTGWDRVKGGIFFFFLFIYCTQYRVGRACRVENEEQEGRAWHGMQGRLERVWQGRTGKKGRHAGNGHERQEKGEQN